MTPYQRRLKKLASNVCKREGLKHEATMGDVEEIIRILTEIEAEHILRENDGVWDVSPLAPSAILFYGAVKLKKKKRVRKKN